MNITFKNRKLQKTCNNLKEAQKEYGTTRGRLAMKRLDELRAVDCLEHMRYLPQARCHELKGIQKGQFSVDLEFPYRLIFEPHHNPVPKKEEGGIDWRKIDTIKILGVENTHGK